MGRDCFGLPQGTGLVRAQRMYLLLWVAVSLVGADRLAHARNRTPLPSSCSSSPRFASEPRTVLLHAADPRTTASAAVVVTTARDGCHALARPLNHAAARLTLPGGCVMTSFLLHIESPDRHYQTLTKPSTCTVRSRRHGHSKASARAIRAGLDITAQGGWRCTCLHMSDSVPALSPIRSYCLDASLAYRVLPLDRTSAASGYSTSRATSSRARWNSYATAKHSTPVPAAAFFYFTQGAWRFHPRCGASLLPLSQLTVAELLQPQSFATGYTPRSVSPARHLALLPASSVTAHCRGATTTAVLLPAIRRAQWALHITSTSSSRRPHAFVHPYYATLGCRETRAVLVTGPSSGRGGG